MKSMRGLRVVVVIDSEHGHMLAARLRRMEVAQVTAVRGLEEARLLCQSGNADACLVAVDARSPMAYRCRKAMLPDDIAEFSHCYVPPATIPPRVLYRRLGAALQGRHAVRREPRWLARGMPLAGYSNSAVFGKPTLH
ncbi:MAG: hypothetical protein WCD87_21265 [Pseudolabrys sp.]